MKKTAMLIGLAAVLGFSSNAQAVDWNWKGDIRYRYESSLTDDNVSTTDDNSRDRHRIRVRFGTDMWINEELSAGLQLATGNDTDPVSRNETLDDSFAADTILLNEAYIDYHPMFLNGDVNLILGKRATKSTLAVIDDLIWDGDVTIEGATVQYGKDAKGKEKDGLSLVAGSYFYDESSVGDDTYILAAQASYKGEVSNLGYQLGASYYGYDNMPDPSLGYDIIELFGSVGGKVSSLPWKVYGQFATNMAENSDFSGITDSRRDGMLVGLKLGKAKNPGQIEGSVEYVQLEEDAVNPAMTDSDRNGGGTNCEGFKISSTYQLIQNMTLGATYFNFNKIDGTAAQVDDTKHLFQLDAVVKF
ncbi:putative porin [Pelodictyon luteolum]|uniref:Porin n=1 Tax=Chlorobium luteolum (strain DSM 273 / BCRC 81028 / 2530) TaxID=319225 RepID=Q3B3H2_CHLL3|nr:putative porin [Pelodictyon luteolum]ABB24109.1 conserved hypothetical protein [Pelodictyon luteolum DSM 273]